MAVYRCAGCGAVNATHAEVATQAMCYRCRRLLDRSGRPQRVDAAALVTTVRSSAAPILVVFAPRDASDAALEGLARASAGELVILRVDPEEEPAAAAAYAVATTPTLVLFEGGSEVARRAGPSSASDLRGWVQQVVAAS